jgi:hypothetical protein
VDGDQAVKANSNGTREHASAIGGTRNARAPEPTVAAKARLDDERLVLVQKRRTPRLRELLRQELRQILMSARLPFG